MSSRSRRPSRSQPWCCPPLAHPVLNAIAACSFLLVFLLSLAFSIASPLRWFAAQAEEDVIKFFTLFGTLGMLTLNGMSLVACDDLHGFCFRDCCGGTVNFAGWGMKLLAVVNTVTYLVAIVKGTYGSLVLCKGLVTLATTQCTAEWEGQLCTALLAISLVFQWLTAWTTGSFFGICDSFTRVDEHRRRRQYGRSIASGLPVASAVPTGGAKPRIQATQPGSTPPLANDQPSISMNQHIDSLAKFAKSLAASGALLDTSGAAGSDSDDEQRGLVADRSLRKMRSARRKRSSSRSRTEKRV